MEILFIILSIIIFFSIFLGLSYVKISNRVEYFKSAKNPEYFIEKYLKIYDVDSKKDVQFKLTDFQKNTLYDILNDRYVEVDKLKSSGMSSILTAYIAWVVLFKQNKKIGIVQSKMEEYILDDVEKHILSVPKFLRKVKLLNNKSNSCNRRFSNNCELKILYCKGVGPRGYTFDYIIWDEYVEKYEKYLSILKTTLYTGGRIVISKSIG